MSLFFQITFLFSDFGFILSVLFDRSVSISSDFSIVKLTLDVFIMDVFESVLLVVSMLCGSFCFTGVFRNRFFCCRLTMGACFMSLFFERWSTIELMILSSFLNSSLRNDICSSRWFINLSDDSNLPA